MALRKKATINQVTAMLATSKNVLFPGYNHLLTTGTDDPTLWLWPERSHWNWWPFTCWHSGNNQSVGPSAPAASRWLRSGNMTFLEVASMAVTRWMVAFWAVRVQGTTLLIMTAINYTVYNTIRMQIHGNLSWSVTSSNARNFEKYYTDYNWKINSYSASRNNWCTVGGDGGCTVGEVRAGTTSPMPDHKGFNLQ